MTIDYTPIWQELGLDLAGHDALLANQVFFYDNPARFTESVNKICDELETRIQEKTGAFPANTPRILVSGCPQAVPNRRWSQNTTPRG